MISYVFPHLFPHLFPVSVVSPSPHLVSPGRPEVMFDEPLLLHVVLVRGRGLGEWEILDFASTQMRTMVLEDLPTFFGGKCR